MRDERTLMLDALTMSANKNLDDTTTLLHWAMESSSPAEKLRYIKMAIRLMDDTARNLEALDGPVG